MRGYLEAYEMRTRTVWVADRFQNSIVHDPSEEAEVPPNQWRSPTDSNRWPPEAVGDLNVVRDGFARFKLLDEKVRFLQGAYGETLPGAPIEKVALLRIATLSYGDTLQVLDLLYDRLSVGGFVVIETYENPQCRQAVDEFRAKHAIESTIERVDWAAASWRKQHADALVAPVQRAERGKRPPLAPPLPSGHKELSVVLCVYNMRREAERTLWSLSRAYQNGVEDLTYEVIVVENGSSESQKLGKEFVASFGPEFIYLDMGEAAALAGQGPELRYRSSMW